jgi:hypothetical protein
MTDVLADMIFRMHLDHNQEQPTKANETLMLLSWRDHMDKNGVPWHAVPALGPGQSPLPGGINTDKAPAFVQAFASLAKRGAAVTCHCPGDKWCDDGHWSARLAEESWGSYWVCATGKCDFRIKAADAGSLSPIPMPEDASKAEAAEPEAAEPEKAEPEKREYSDEDLLAALQERCEFQVEKIKCESALAFARHLQKLAAVELWTHALARAQWAKWQEQKTSQAVAA